LDLTVAVDRFAFDAVRSRVEEVGGAVVITHGQGAAVGAERFVTKTSAAAAHYGNRGSVAKQCSEQVSASLKSVIKREACARKQKRSVEARLDERLRAESLGIGALGSRLRIVTLYECEGSGRNCDRDQRERQRTLPAQPAIRPLLAFQLRRRNMPALLEKRPLAGVQLVGVIFEPLQRAREPRAAIQLGLVLSTFVPLSGGLHEVSVERPATRVFVEPPSKSRPVRDQRLVRNLDRCRGARDETRVGQDLQDPPARRVLDGFELDNGNCPPHRRLVTSPCDEP
jgi:hypothetical protein